MIWRAARRSPQEIDPLSWFTGPRFPVVLGIVTASIGIVSTVAQLQYYSQPLLQFSAAAMFLVVGLLIARWTAPTRPRLDPWRIAIVSGAGMTAFGLSAWGSRLGVLPVEQWWASAALMVTIISLAPYLTAVEVISVGLPMTVEVAAVAYFVFVPVETFFLPTAVVLIVAGPIFVATAAAAAFSTSVVLLTMRAQLAAAVAPVSFTPSVHAPAIDEQIIENVAARVVPFIETIARTGVVSDDDRTFAGQLARRLRSDLVESADRSWLDEVLAGTGAIVSGQPDLADRMNDDQRTALRELLEAVLASPVVDPASVLIELRPMDNGATAVGLTIDLDLPEGRRAVLLAPYYLALKTTVENLAWEDGRNLLLTFQVPAPPQ